MNVWALHSKKLLLFLAVSLVLTATIRANGVSGTATYTDTVVSPGVYQYDLTLTNTGSTTIGTFWFSWIPGAGFMPATPTDVESPSGWTDNVTNGGGAIQWVTSSPLGAGGTETGFEFDSTMTPTQLAGSFPGPGLGTGDPIATAFLYIGAPFGDPGEQIVATPGVATTPEPGSLCLTATAIGLLAMIMIVSRKKTSAI